MDLLYAFALMCACIALHETGHLVAARHAGVRILIFSVGPLKWLGAPDGVGRFSLELPLALGQCLAWAPDDERLRPRTQHYLDEIPLLPANPLRPRPDTVAWARADAAILLASGPTAEALATLDAIPTLADEAPASIHTSNWRVRLRSALDMRVRASHALPAA